MGLQPVVKNSSGSYQPEVGWGEAVGSWQRAASEGGTDKPAGSTSSCCSIPAKSLGQATHWRHPFVPWQGAKPRS